MGYKNGTELGRKGIIGIDCCLHDFYVKDFDIFLRLFFIYSRILDFVNDIQALNSSSKYSVLVVEPRLEWD